MVTVRYLDVKITVFISDPLVQVLVVLVKVVVVGVVVVEMVLAMGLVTNTYCVFLLITCLLLSFFCQVIAVIGVVVVFIVVLGMLVVYL